MQCLRSEPRSRGSLRGNRHRCNRPRCGSRGPTLTVNSCATLAWLQAQDDSGQSERGGHIRGPLGCVGSNSRRRCSRRPLPWEQRPTVRARRKCDSSLHERLAALAPKMRPSRRLALPSRRRVSLIGRCPLSKCERPMDHYLRPMFDEAGIGSSDGCPASSS
jgi:hypothetical protein